ncbi:hypothetical protein BTA35_0200230 [Oceanospirillum linum]|uniref:Uncharacterized protein n=1 Tax=Oceanospirillum linum TaxID=966 RepID=A0A1T1HDY6_OCELI|nr:hypothetical protein BTA35_0200230 [Oceanospirillum linum]
MRLFFAEPATLSGYLKTCQTTGRPLGPVGYDKQLYFQPVLYVSDLIQDGSGLAAIVFKVS